MRHRATLSDRLIGRLFRSEINFQIAFARGPMELPGNLQLEANWEGSSF